LYGNQQHFLVEINFFAFYFSEKKDQFYIFGIKTNLDTNHHKITKNKNRN